MNTTEYKNTKAILSQKVSDLKKELALLKTNYIKTNRQFEDGEEVVVTDRKGETSNVFIRYCNTGYKDEILYKFLKKKKDGTPSKFEHSHYGVIKVEKLK